MNIIKYIYNYLLLTISSNLLLIILSSLLPLVVNLINGILYLDSILFFNISLSFCLLSFLWYLYPSTSTANNGILLILLYIKKSIWVLWWEVYFLYSTASNVLTFSNESADYLSANFNNPDFSKKAASKYIECWDGAGGWWNWMAGKFMKAGSSDAYVLLGGGGHKPLSEF